MDTRGRSNLPTATPDNFGVGELGVRDNVYVAEGRDSGTEQAPRGDGAEARGDERNAQNESAGASSHDSSTTGNATDVATGSNLDSLRQGSERIGELASALTLSLGNFIQQAFQSGIVDELPAVRDDGWMVIAEGWLAKLLFRGGIRDIYLKIVTDDAVLPTHSHKQVQQVYVISGAVRVTVEGVNHDLFKGDSIVIKGHEAHGLSGIGHGDSMLITVYEPPITHDGSHP